ncbi:cytochrome P450 [Penicillium odoratum]|uniref:cytochrome P450 n=1 Tax=Penicillium odoratum TaxID=1167516 RepID=UPI002547AEE1|nr:cytochrome P450 [Penicillium odoratum]KAJ5746816.1 cytochrome P450 [Penicillium odoratum]
MAWPTTLATLLSPAPSQIAPTFTVLGAAFHQCIRTLEIDNRIKSLLALYLGAWLALCGTYICVYSLGTFCVIGRSLLAACCFNFGLAISILIYRAFFHRLSRFSGPWDAKLSRLFPLQQGIKQTQYHLDLQKLHQQYGDFQWGLKSDKTPQDVISWLVKALEEKDQAAPPGAQALNDDGRLIIIAGSDTTARTLAHALYYLVKTPSAYQSLLEELDNAFGSKADTSEFTNEKLCHLPCLQAVINETLRLKPAVPSVNPILTSPHGLHIEEVWIPGDTIVVIPQYVLQRDERYFPSGSEFIPERWLEGKNDFSKHEEAYFPFQIGRYSCVGK